jgi:hypothetical protein
MLRTHGLLCAQSHLFDIEEFVILSFTGVGILLLSFLADRIPDTSNVHTLTVHCLLFRI